MSGILGMKWGIRKPRQRRGPTPLFRRVRCAACGMLTGYRAASRAFDPTVHEYAAIGGKRGIEVRRVELSPEEALGMWSYAFAQVIAAVEHLARRRPSFGGAGGFDALNAFTSQLRGVLELISGQSWHPAPELRLAVAQARAEGRAEAVRELAESGALKLLPPVRMSPLVAAEPLVRVVPARIGVRPEVR